MVVNEQLKVGCTFGCVVVPLNHPLVVALHEVNLQTFYAPLLEFGKSLVHLLFESQPCHPKNDAYVLLLTVADEFCKVDFGYYVKHCLVDVVPAFIENYILNTVL